MMKSRTLIIVFMLSITMCCIYIYPDNDMGKIAKVENSTNDKILKNVSVVDEGIASSSTVSTLDSKAATNVKDNKKKKSTLKKIIIKEENASIKDNQASMNVDKDIPVENVLIENIQLTQKKDDKNKFIDADNYSIDIESSDIGATIPETVRTEWERKEYDQEVVLSSAEIEWNKTLNNQEEIE